MRKRYTENQIRRAAISNMNIKTRLMQAKKKPIQRFKGYAYNSARHVIAKQTPRKRKPGIIKLPAEVMAQLGFPPNAWQ